MEPTKTRVLRETTDADDRQLCEADLCVSWAHHTFGIGYRFCDTHYRRAVEWQAKQRAEARAA